MASDRLLVRGGQVYDHGGDVHKPKPADVLIENGEIAAVGAGLNAAGAEVIDARNCLVIPGLINAHNHTCQSTARGLADDIPVTEWLSRIVPFEATLQDSREFFRKKEPFVILGRTTLLTRPGSRVFCDSFFGRNSTVDKGLPSQEGSGTLPVIEM